MIFARADLVSLHFCFADESNKLPRILQQFHLTFTANDRRPRSVALCLVLILCFASVALADHFKTIDGKEYKDATVSGVEPDGIVLRSKSGISKVYFVELPKGIQEHFHYDAPQAAVFSTAQQAVIEDSNAEVAAQQQQEGEERQRRAVAIAQQQQQAEEQQRQADAILVRQQQRQAQARDRYAHQQQQKATVRQTRERERQRQIAGAVARQRAQEGSYWRIRSGAPQAPLLTKSKRRWRLEIYSTSHHCRRVKRPAASQPRGMPRSTILRHNNDSIMLSSRFRISAGKNKTVGWIVMCKLGNRTARQTGSIGRNRAEGQHIVNLHVRLS
jgi:hypothetical protein